MTPTPLVLCVLSTLYRSFCSKLACNGVMLQMRKQSHRILFRVPQLAIQAQHVFSPKICQLILSSTFNSTKKNMYFMGGGLVFNFNIQMNSRKYLGWLKTKPYVCPHLQLACPRSTQIKCRCSRSAQSLFSIPSPPQRQMTSTTRLLLTFLSGLYFRVKIGRIQLILVCPVNKKMLFG